MKNWFLEQLKKPLSEWFRQISNRSNEDEYRKIVRDANEVSEMLASQGWNVVRREYSEQLLRTLDELYVRFEQGKLKSDDFKVELARLVGQSQAFGVINGILANKEMAEKELASLVEKKKQEEILRYEMQFNG